MKQLRICLVTSFYPPFHAGGCGLHVYHLANLLAADGHRVEVLCSGAAHAYKIRDRRAGDYPHHQGVRVHRIVSPLGRGEVLLTYLLGRPVLSRRPLAEVLRGEFDVIHYHNISLFGGISILKEGRAVKLFTQHTYWLFCPTHYLWKMKNRVCEKKECLRCLLSYRRPPQFWRWTGRRDRFLAEVDSLVMPCWYMLERHREEGFGGRMDLLPYFVNPVPERSAPGGEEPAGREPFFLFVARLEPYKGPQAAVSAFRRWRGKADLLMVGTGSMAGELRRLAEGDPRIRFLDYVSPEKLDLLYRRAVALLAPSLWPEMGNQTVLQAQSCGTPAIVSAAGLLPELVRNGETGIVFKKEDELGAALTRMLDQKFRDQLAGPCRAAYRADHTPERFRERYYRLLSDLRPGLL